VTLFDLAEFTHKKRKTTTKEILSPLIKYLTSIKSDDERMAAINHIRETIHELSPMKHEPVDFVKWVKIEEVIANEYNPNKVAPPEMKLLQEGAFVLPIRLFCFHPSISTEARSW